MVHRQPSKVRVTNQSGRHATPIGHACWHISILGAVWDAVPAAVVHDRGRNRGLLERYGKNCHHVQDGCLPRGQSRATEHGAARRSRYGDAPNAALPKPLAPDCQLLIERRPLMVVPAEDTAPMPLDLTLGITVWLLELAVECVIYANGEAAGAAFSLNLGNLFRSAAKVAPTPFFGGGFEGKECHRIGRQLMPVRDQLSLYAQPRHALAFRLARQLGQHLLPGCRGLSVWR